MWTTHKLLYDQVAPLGAHGVLVGRYQSGTARFSGEVYFRGTKAGIAVVLGEGGDILFDNGRVMLMVNDDDGSYGLTAVKPVSID